MIDHRLSYIVYGLLVVGYFLYCSLDIFLVLFVVRFPVLILIVT